MDNAATTGTTGLQWFKVAGDGLSNGKWAVDTMIANGGWHYFDMPTCVAPGDYLMRVESVPPNYRLHVSSNFVSFPGAYKANDAGIQVNIYDATGKPYMGGKAYSVPGPAPLTCAAGQEGGSGSTPSTQEPAPVPEAPAAGAALYAQCGGKTWTGPTTCAQGTCKESSEHYSQCLP